MSQSRARPSRPIRPVQLVLGGCLLAGFIPAALTFAQTAAPTEVSPAPQAPALQLPTAKVLPTAARGRAEVLLGDSVIALGGGARLIYENFNGSVAVDFGANRLVSDDVSTSAPDGCRLRRFEFEVDGRVNPQLAGGPFTVNFALYRQCPYATSAGSTRDALRIPGTIGSVEVTNDDPQVISVIVTDEAALLPPRFWLGLSFSRGNAGLILGAPPTTGHSADVFDYPGSACQATLGGFPAQPHASFNIRVFAAEDCPPAHVGYQSARESGSGINAGSTQVPLLDDLELGVSGCRMVGLGVGVRAPGSYTIDLRRACDEEPIPGTSQSFLIGQSSGQEPRVRWLTFDPPVELPKRLWFAGKVNNLNAGFIVTSAQPSFGSTEDFFVIGNGESCLPQDFRVGVDALHLSIVCEGDAPTGACCDAYQPQCSGGTSEGSLCETDADCAPEGVCEARCVDVPRINCTFPSANAVDSLLPGWQEGESCETQPFQHPCGVWACCTPDGGCENLTKAECDAREPEGAPRQWQIGKYCHYLDQECPIVACLDAEGRCELPHQEPGCLDAECCVSVCELDPWCCDVEWDNLCVRWVDERCQIAPGNDTCPGAFLIEAGQTLPALSSTTIPLDLSDPAICCHNGLPLMCQGGDFIYKTCLNEEDCRNILNPEAECGMRIPQPFASTWYKFIAESKSAQITVCGDSANATDAIVQVFTATDPGSPASECASLEFVACAEDGAECGVDLPAVCMNDLIPGQTYYVIVGAKSYETRGRYQITLESPCPSFEREHSSCPELPYITPGPLALAWQPENFQCPPEDCMPRAGREMWARYVPDCTGSMILHNQSCAGGDRPELMVAVYEGCDVCPGEEAPEPLVCKSDLNCPSCLPLPAVAGHCYTIRLGQEAQEPPTGMLEVGCYPSCPALPYITPGPLVAAWQPASSQCLADDCMPGAGREMWARYVPDCTGSIILRNERCGTGDRPELMVAVYEGCDACPGEEALMPLVCEPGFNCPSFLSVLAVAGHCYTIRVAEGSQGWPTATLDLTCHSANWPSCDPAPVFIHEPLSGTVDARQPTSQSGTPLGIDRLTVHVEPETTADCWAFCESEIGEQPNYIREFVAEGLPGDANFSFLLARPISTGAVTTLQYLGESLGEDYGEYISHPGNVNGDGLADADDVLQLLDVLEGEVEAVWGKYSVDCDHSGEVNALDLLCVIDLLNNLWNGTPRPQAEGICP